MFRQTNIIWVLFAFVYNQLRTLQFRNAVKEQKPVGLYDPQALSVETCLFPFIIFLAGAEWSPADWLMILKSIPGVVTMVLPQSIPFLVDVLLFAVFIYWNGGIVLGESL